MTFTEEYLGDEDDLQGGSEYPSAFGITFTPRISGIAIGVYSSPKSPNRIR
jgi:type IV pilus assembly protein PilO